MAKSSKNRKWNDVPLGADLVDLSTGGVLATIRIRGAGYSASLGPVPLSSGPHFSGGFRTDRQAKREAVRFVEARAAYDAALAARAGVR